MINKKEVMRRAWEIAKAGQKKFGGKVVEYLSVALKFAWKELKKVVELVGSPKQIAWAEDIRNRVISKMEAVIEELKKQDKMKKPTSARFFEEYKKHFENLKNVAEARVWIDLFGYSKLHIEIVNAFKRFMMDNGDDKTPQVIFIDARIAQQLDYNNR